MAWRDEAAGMWLQQRPKLPIRAIHGPYTIQILAVRPDKRKRDLGNLEKVVSDFLEWMLIIEGDHLAEALSVRWVPDGDPKTVRVLLYGEEEEAARGD